MSQLALVSLADLDIEATPPAFDGFRGFMFRSILVLSRDIPSQLVGLHGYSIRHGGIGVLARTVDEELELSFLPLM